MVLDFSTSANNHLNDLGHKMAQTPAIVITASQAPARSVPKDGFKLGKLVTGLLLPPLRYLFPTPSAAVSTDGFKLGKLVTGLMFLLPRFTAVASASGSKYSQKRSIGVRSQILALLVWVGVVVSIDMKN